MLINRDLKLEEGIDDSTHTYSIAPSLYGAIG